MHGFRLVLPEGQKKSEDLVIVEGPSYPVKRALAKNNNDRRPLVPKRVERYASIDNFHKSFFDGPSMIP